MIAPHRLRLVRFLNAAPLAWGILRGSLRAEGLSVEARSPSTCADDLRHGRADAALVPLIEAVRIPGAVISGPLGVGARGDVDSVLLVSRRPRLQWEDVAAARSVALDASSRSSVALFRTLLHLHGLREPELVTQDPDPLTMLAGHEVSLVIGDVALRLVPEIERGELAAIDLSGEWHRLTGLPFTFAVWAVAPGVDPAAAADLLGRSWSEGRARLDEIIEEAARELDLPRAFVGRYLRERVQYRIDGADFVEGRRRFLEEARAAGVLGAPEA